jgi:hypothetical protein
MTVSMYMDVYGRILEYSIDIVMYIRFLEGTYLKGTHMYIKT